MSLHIRDRLLARVFVDINGPCPVDEAPCWIWTGRLHHGYGRIGRNGKTEFTHRVAWELLHGPIPAGMQIDHLCRNRGCCNPAHLEVVTPRINTLRSNGVTAVNARKTHCPQGHEFDALNTAYWRGPTARDCMTCKREAWRRWHERKATPRRDRAQHGTEARARKHWRDGEKPCPACRNAVNQAQRLRARKQVAP